jgi:diguanylate cyclase (GGDEF)-like protein/PAS domain S-box-containing protein
MAGHLRTTVVAMTVLVVAVPLFFWLSSIDLILGDPWVLALLLPLIIFMADDHAQQQLGGGRLDDSPILRLVLATLMISVLCWTAGWSLLVPAAAILLAVPVIHHSRGRFWVAVGAIVTVVTVGGQLGLVLDYIPSVLDAAPSHFAAGGLLVIAWGAAALVARDAADASDAAAALARAEARLRALMESSTDVLTVSAADGRLTYVSPAVERAMGYRAADLLGRSLLDLVDAEHRPGVTTRLEDVEARGADARSSMDVLVVHASLERRWYEWTFHNLLQDELVRGMVVQQRDVTERLQAQRALAHAASHDDLTGLPNRAELLRRMLSSLPQAGPSAAVAVLFVDLDLFKEVNDRLGHQAGDDVLVVVARRLAATLRAHDHLGRLGGDEFGVLLTEVRDEDEVKAVVGRLVSALEQPITLPNASVTVGASVGYSITTDPTTPLDRLLATADARMYATKTTRRR